MSTQLVQHHPQGFEHEQLREVWKHACFLVRVAYDLDWAVGQFKTLEEQAPNCLIKAILLLNIGITYTLQADYRHAEQAFKKVLPLHSFMAPLAHYLLGVVRFELSDYEQAQISFKLCAYTLKQTDCNRAYHYLGLDFTLSHHLVVENEEIAAYEWTLKQKGRYGFRLLHRMPASLVFDTAVLDTDSVVCCDRTAKQYSPLSTVTSSVSSVYSEDVSSTTDVIKDPTTGPVQDLPTPTLPVIPWQPLKKSMTPRAAQAEASNIRSLTHFLKYTGPEDQRTTRAETATDASRMIVPMNTFHAEGTKRTGPVRLVLSQAANQADNASQVLRKASILTLKKAESIRQMTKTVFSMPMERLGAVEVDQNRSMEEERVMAGPRHRPVVGVITHLSNPTAHNAVLGTIPEGGEKVREQQQAKGRISMDSHLIFSHGRLMI